jgi:hypothetical protein
MAGSKRWFRYTDDGGTNYSVNLDESNSEATIGGIPLFLNRTAAHPIAPTGLRKRYINAFLTSNPAIKRKFWVGNPLAIAQVGLGGAFLAAVYPTSADAASVAVAWTVTSFRGEKSSAPPALSVAGGDTGLTDGDVPRDA